MVDKSAGKKVGKAGWIVIKEMVVQGVAVLLPGLGLLLIAGGALLTISPISGLGPILIGAGVVFVALGLYLFTPRSDAQKFWDSVFGLR